jgi:hypothetical protein
MKTARIVAIVLLLFNGLSAIAGAIPMLIDPHGQPENLPQSFLDHSPFTSFLIPGIILLVANGLLSLYALWRAAKRKADHWLWVGAQGCILLGWLTVECIILRFVAWPHYLYGLVGLGLVLSGFALRPGVSSGK